MLICPICKKSLSRNNNNYICSDNHCYNIARQGYVNLLPVQNKHSLHPGDTKEMLIARREFLNQGNYISVCDALISSAKNAINSIQNPVIADIGCGEGYYTQQVASSFEHPTVYGIDISKDAVKMACSRSKSITWAVATASLLPLQSESTDLITAMFSLFQENEFLRVLKSGGYAIEITVATEHLIELKQIIYDEVFTQNKKPAPVNEFETISCDKHSFKLELDNKNLISLLQMTPHFWRIKEERRKILEKMDCLEVTVAFWVRVLRKP